MAMIDISRVINISVSIPPTGLAPYSINNLVCFTKDVPVGDVADYEVYASAADVATAWGSTSATYLAAQSVFAQSPNILTGGGRFVVVKLLTDETLSAAILRAKALIYFGACSYAYAAGDAEILAAAVTAEAQSKLLFVSSASSASLDSPDGLFYKVKSQSLAHARCLLYLDADGVDAFRWGYAGRAMSVNFSGSNTTSTMHLKAIKGVAADLGLSETILTKCEAVGADVYSNIAGVSCVLSNGENSFFDDVYNLDWFVGALQVAGFNYLRQTGTKVPQTEEGVDGLKGAYRRVCGQGITNRFVAAGEWTGADTFGNPEDFERNIRDFGYYIYSVPVASQPVADRTQRKAPLIQIAIKYSGAIHSSDVLVSINL